MKTSLIKFRALGLIALLTFFLSSCSDDGDKSMSFLEKHSGTVWKISEQGASIYAKINNSETNPFEIWASLFDVCYVYESLTETGNTEVLENKENKFVIRIEEGPSSYTILTLSVALDVLTITSESYEEGNLEDEEFFIMRKTSDDVNTLEICEI